MDRNQRTKVNIIFVFLLDIFTIISGFIIPRLIISSFGSEINGLTCSISDFIGYIGLLQTGIGSAIKSALYKPLAKKDQYSISVIVKTTERFFYKIAIFTFFYIIVLSIIFQPIFATDFDYLFTLILVIIIGLGTAAQYLFGITYQMVLEADQRSYIYSIIQILTIIFNTIAVYVAIKLQASIIIVKLCSAVFFVVRPIILGFYTRKKYAFFKNVNVDNNYIRQRWNAFGQGITFFIHSKTDILVLTLLSTFVNVSIYSVYALVVKGLSGILNGVEKVIRSAFGNILANNEKRTLHRNFSAYLSLIHIVCTAVFATASITVFHFVEIYVKNVDAKYYQPFFGIIIIAAECFYCLRLPYYTIIFAAGKFKETQVSAYIEAILNVIISFLLVFKFGLIGVALGTLVAMIYRTISFIKFLHKNILNLDYFQQCRRYVLTTVIYVSSVYILSFVKIEIITFKMWFLYAGIVFIITAIYTIIINLLFDRSNTLDIVRLILK